MRNREVRLYCLAMAAVALVVTGMVYQWAPQAVPAFLCGFGALCLLSAGFTWYRYRQIAQLADYLRRVAAGDFTLEIQDHKEGELSLLRTEIYKVVMRLSEQKDQMGRERQALADAISNISHQLKTPITSMTVMADLLRQPDLDPQRRQEFTRSIQTQLQRIEWLVTSLLKLARLDAGVITFQCRPVDLSQLLQRALDPIRIPLDVKDIQVKICDQTQQPLLCDSQWTAEALLNVLKNCMEHRPEGGSITIEATENPLYTQVVILDSGPGIRRQELPYVFQRFYRGKEASAGSVGIGLAMARSFLEGQNADITALPGPGGHFVLRFYKQATV